MSTIRTPLTQDTQYRVSSTMSLVIDAAPDTRDSEHQRAAFYAEMARRLQALADSYDV